MTALSTIFDEMISPERLFEAWYEFRRGKGSRRDVQEFGRHAEKHIFRLHRDLASGAYRHSPYESFFVHDPKRRHILATGTPYFYEVGEVVDIAG